MTGRLQPGATGEYYCPRCGLDFEVSGTAEGETFVPDHRSDTFCCHAEATLLDWHIMTREDVEADVADRVYHAAGEGGAHA